MSEQKKSFAFSTGLEQTRAFAALGVWLLHVRLFLGLTPHSYWDITVQRLGPLCVALFLVLTGFLFENIYEGGKKPIQWTPFIQNRCFRILPVYFIMIIFYQMTNWQSFSSITLLNFLLFIPNFYDIRTGLIPVVPVWTIGPEFWFYIIFPFFIKALSGKIKQMVGIILLANTLVILYTIKTRLQDEMIINSYITILGHLGQFILGIISAEICRKYKNYINRNILWIFFISSIIMFFMYVKILEITKAQTYISIIKTLDLTFFGILASVIIVSVWIIGGIKGKLGKAISNFGKISYSFYLLHCPVSFVLLSDTHISKIFFHSHPWVQVTLLGFVPSAIVAAISYFSIEKPFIEYRKKSRTASARVSRPSNSSKSLDENDNSMLVTPFSLVKGRVCDVSDYNLKLYQYPFRLYQQEQQVSLKRKSRSV